MFNNMVYVVTPIDFLCDKKKMFFSDFILNNFSFHLYIFLTYNS